MIATVCNARFSARSPPWLRRCRLRCPRLGDAGPLCPRSRKMDGGGTRRPRRTCTTPVLTRAWLSAGARCNRSSYSSHVLPQKQKMCSVKGRLVRLPSMGNRMLSPCTVDDPASGDPGRRTSGDDIDRTDSNDSDACTTRGVRDFGDVGTVRRGTADPTTLRAARATDPHPHPRRHPQIQRSRSGYTAPDHRTDRRGNQSSGGSPHSFTGNREHHPEGTSSSGPRNG